MDLKDFVKASLQQILEGVKEAQARVTLTLKNLAAGWVVAVNTKREAPTALPSQYRSGYRMETGSEKKNGRGKRRDPLNRHPDGRRFKEATTKVFGVYRLSQNL
mgnify:CR=1 FL=1